MGRNKKKRRPSYKKLKLKNEQLWHDIRCLTREGDTDSGIELKTQYLLIFAIEDVVMFGNREGDH